MANQDATERIVRLPGEEATERRFVLTGIKSHFAGLGEAAPSVLRGGPR
jgi:hypothetical protein